MSYLSLKFPGGEEIQAPPGIPSGEGFSIGSLASFSLQLLMVIGIFLSLFYLIYGGFYWIQSRGNKEKLDKARRIIFFAIIGLIIMSLALVIVNLVASAFGVKTVVNP